MVKVKGDLERKVRAEILVRDNGRRCSPFCKWIKGDWCDLFLEKVYKNGQVTRLDECMEAEVKE